ncbi:RNA polymerase sigma factor [Spirillospora sp. CA-253888]
MTPLPPDDHASFERFFREHQRWLLSYLVGMCDDDGLAEDVLIEAFLVLWRQWHRAAVRRGQPAAYLLTVARRLMWKELRSRELLPRPTDKPPEEGLHGVGSVEEAVIRDDRLRWALARLSPREREAVLLRYYLGYSGELTARMMAPVTAGAVKRYAFDGRRKLQELLGEGDGDDMGGGQR